MTPNQKTFEYEGGRFTRLQNWPISEIVGGEIIMKYRNCPQNLSPQMESFLDGYFDQDTELTLEVS